MFRVFLIIRILVCEVRSTCVGVNGGNGTLKNGGNAATCRPVFFNCLPPAPIFLSRFVFCQSIIHWRLEAHFQAHFGQKHQKLGRSLTHPTLRDASSPAIVLKEVPGGLQKTAAALHTQSLPNAIFLPFAAGQCL